MPTQVQVQVSMCKAFKNSRTTTGRGSLSPWPVGGTEPSGCLPYRLHWFLPGEGCRGLREEATTWTPPSPPTSRPHTVPQGVRPLTRSGSRPYMPTVQGGAANTRTLATEMASGNIPLVVPRPHSESSQPTSRRCWRLQGPPSRAPGARLNNNNNNNDNRQSLFTEVTV